MREIVIGMIWGLGLMAAMLVTVRLYRGDFNRRHLFLFYGFTGLAGIVLRLFGRYPECFRYDGNCLGYVADYR